MASIPQGHLEEVTPEFTKKDEWPPQSPDCNPMDYAMGLSEEESLPGRVRDKLNKRALNDTIIMSWEVILVEEIHESISAWKNWLCLVM